MTLMFRLSFYPLFGSYLTVLTLTAILVFTLLLIRPGGDRLPQHKRLVLMSLRFAALFLLFFAMLRPAFVYTKTEQLASTLHLLLDQSESMARSDEFGNKQRFVAAKEAIENVQPQLERLQRQAEVNAFLFDSKLFSVDVKKGTLGNLPEQPLGKETAIGAALDKIREQSVGKRVLGIVLLSDGTQRTRPSATNSILPHNAAVHLRDSGIPLYTIRLGQSETGNAKDVSLGEIQANEQIFIKNNFVVNGSVRINGYPNKDIPVQLFFEDEKGKMISVAETTLRGGSDGQLIPFRLTYKPETTGYFKYTVKVPAQEKELIETNNEQSDFVRVVDGGLSVLYIQGERNLEQGHLRYSLNASSDIHVDYRSIRTGLTAVNLGSGETAQRKLETFTQERPSWVNNAFKADAYNVYILDDIDSKAFKTEELKELAHRVRDGAGLIMLGGLHAFAAGGYADTPLAAAVPVEMRAADRQPFDAPIRDDIHYPPPLSIKLTTGGKKHYVLRLVSNLTKNEELWNALPPLAGANRFDKLKPGATLLAEGPDGQRLLVSQLYGLGRVLAFAGDSTYRWKLGGFVDEHKRFWRQVVLWLARMEDVSAGDCWITVENARLMPGDTAKFRVFAKNPGSGKEENKNPAPATIVFAEVKAVVVKPDGSEEKVQIVDEEGIKTGSFRSTEAAGDYTIRVDATLVNLNANEKEGVLKTATARFMVQDQNLESDNPVASPQLLKNIAETTGGYSLPAEQLRKLLDELTAKSNELVEKRETKRSLYDSWLLLAAFTAVLGSEWFLRKYWGLI